ncbi:hypothetical protein IT072_15420 [Leifsonia sp. ZF2019]|uniref:hypothetical protein n=1 Tax=Leifsonia sp. ZF2019 TaxID=2781978 RepID=UPI001CC1102E|nr:hypothetical protein [Leifsonia sp. ZF2019]UAJ78618.1 hypothetical protein IT072_15420 [Leifsonia sp. ZF2019]
MNNWSGPLLKWDQKRQVYFERLAKAGEKAAKDGRAVKRKGISIARGIKIPGLGFFGPLGALLLLLTLLESMSDD